MKKLTASIAVCIYFAFACGVMVNYHYCMDRYDSFRLYKTSSDLCNRCGMHTKTRGCCHDEVKIVKLQDDHQTSSASIQFKNIQPAVTSLNDLITAELMKSDPLFDHLNHSPPLLVGQDIWLRNRVFRI